MTKTTPEQNKAIVLEAFGTLFNKRDYAAAERFWSDSYIQHSAHMRAARTYSRASRHPALREPRDPCRG
jgi:predicted SnoaL-like aldol condensation-catalyzing enzyme